jgi:hypothetical protein
MKLKKMSFSTGGDPEIGLINKQTGKFVSAIDVIKKGKYDPIKLENGISCYYDNVLLEASFPPSFNKEEFVGIYRETFKQISKKLGDKYQIAPVAACVFDDSELQHEDAKAAGCSANFDFYTITQNPKIEFNDGTRTTSCHIHVGNEKLGDFKTRIQALKVMDIVVGCASVLFDKDPTSVKRRTWYGRSGEHRVANFDGGNGFEWRILSSYVLRSPKLLDLIYTLVEHAMALVESNLAEKTIKAVKESIVRDAIDNCDCALALEVLKTIKLPKELMDKVLEQSKIEYKIENFNKEWAIE